ncbi:MAG: SOUL family heme-binding protein [Acholeplasmataceae bacterium]
MAYEKLKYKVIKKDNQIEIRTYDPFVTMKASRPRTNGFNTLFRYISGDNEKNQQISMTVPVITDLKEQDYIAFTMPEEVVKQGYPKANNPYIEFEEHPEKTYVAIRFTGLLAQTKKYVSKLETYVKTHELKTISEPVLLRYQGPFVPAFLRTHDIMIEIQ